jgi:trehalose 6-phosphate phosphatase
MPDARSIRLPEDVAASRTGAALFLDFDGTLVDIAPRPDAVVVQDGLPDLLQRLRGHLGGALAIVSGRPLSVIDFYLAPHRFDVAGLHGAEQRIGGAVAVEPMPDARRLRQAVELLRQRAEGRPGLIVEDKGRSVALHWRLAPALAGYAADAVAEAERVLGPDYRVQDGKDVLELLPRFATKAAAIARFMESEPYRGRTPYFIGDDRTDEHGFGIVAAMGGTGIRIGAGDTLAARRMDSPAVLRQWLADCALHGTILFKEDIS